MYNLMVKFSSFHYFFDGCHLVLMCVCVPRGRIYVCTCVCACMYTCVCERVRSHLRIKVCLCVYATTVTQIIVLLDKCSSCFCNVSLLHKTKQNKSLAVFPLISNVNVISFLKIHSITFSGLLPSLSQCKGSHVVAIDRLRGQEFSHCSFSFFY